MATVRGITGSCCLAVWLKLSAFCSIMVLVQSVLKRWNFEMDLLVQWFYQLLETEKVARLSVQTINAKSSQPNKSLKLTVAARWCVTCGLR